MTRILLLLLFSVSIFLYPQTGITLGVGATYTVQAKVYPYPNDIASEFRNKSFSYSHILAPTLWVSAPVFKDIALEISFEYLKQTHEEKYITVLTDAKTKQFKGTEGFHLVPIDIGATYRLPFSTNVFAVTMSGGLGIYYAKVIREIGTLGFETENGNWSSGLQVALGIDYEFIKNFPVTFRMKFREPTLWMKGNFSSDSGVVEGNPFYLGTTKGESRLISDGLVFMLGISTKIGF